MTDSPARLSIPAIHTLIPRSSTIPSAETVGKLYKGLQLCPAPCVAVMRLNRAVPQHI